MTITVKAIKFDSGASKVLALLRARTRAENTPQENAVMEQAKWLNENDMKVSYRSKDFEWDFEDEQDAVAFKLRFGL